MKKNSSKNKKFPEYDFLGSIYKNTKQNELKESFESIRNQTLQPKNIILVIDGFIEKGVSDLVNEYKKILPIKIISLEKNFGLGLALRKGLQKCQSSIVLRFDSDDINLQYRAQYLVEELNKGSADIVGSNAYEFTDNPQKYVSIKKVPLTHESIKRYIFFRNPINHPSVGFLKDSIVNLKGGYRHFPFYEDYDLWIRALFSGLKFANIDKELIAIRINKQRERRIGYIIARSECKLLITFFEKSIFHGLLYLPSSLLRIFFALLPIYIVNFIYKNILREKKYNN